MLVASYNLIGRGTERDKYAGFGADSNVGYD